jgi:hypothetical protein
MSFSNSHFQACFQGVCALTYKYPVLAQETAGNQNNRKSGDHTKHSKET